MTESNEPLRQWFHDSEEICEHDDDPEPRNWPCSIMTDHLTRSFRVIGPIVNRSTEVDLEDDILTVLIQTSRQNLEPGELAKKIADKLKSRDEGLREAAQRLVDVIFAEAQAEPFVLPLRGMRAANDLRAALEETA